MPRIRPTASCPSTGRLEHFDARRATAIRDRYRRRGGRRISPFYDPMIAKLIAPGDDRDEARRRRCVEALDAGRRLAGQDQCRLPRPTAVGHPDFARGRGRYRLHRRSPDRQLGAAGRARTRRCGMRGRRRLAGRGLSSLAGRTLAADPWRRARRASAPMPSRTLAVALAHGGETRSIEPIGDDPCDGVARHGRRRACSSFYEGQAYRFTPAGSAAGRAAAAAGDGAIVSPMPGKIIAVDGEAGRRGDQGPEAAHARGDEDGA